MRFIFNGQYTEGVKKRHTPQTPTPKGDKGFSSFVHYYGARKPWQNPAIPGRLSAGEMAAEETLFHRARTVYCARHFVQGLKVLSARVTYTAVAGVVHVPLRFPRKGTTRSQNYIPTAVGRQKGETIIISNASPLPGKQRHYHGPPCRSSGINVFLRLGEL